MSQRHRHPRAAQDVPFRFGTIVSMQRVVMPTMAGVLSLVICGNAPRTREISGGSSTGRAGAGGRGVARGCGVPVVGVDLVGAEAGYPAGDHQAAFQYAHSHFLRKTTHAGEAYGPQSIFQAITSSGANPIGYGTCFLRPTSFRGPAIASSVT